MPDPLIDYQAVTVRAGELTVLDGVSFAVTGGEVVVLQGRSGAGKSTILRALFAAPPPTSGTIVFDATALSPRSIGAFRSRIAYVAQEPVLGRPTVREALLLPFTYRATAARCGGPPPAEALAAALERVGIDASQLDQSTSDLSGGEKQRVALARELLRRPEVLVADEVTAALDADTGSAVADLLRGEVQRTGLTILAASHDPAITALSDRRLTVAAGRIVEQPAASDGNGNGDRSDRAAGETERSR